MSISRRGFLGGVTAAAAGFALDPELALWKPGAKTFFLPPAIPERFASMQDFTNEALRELKRALGAGILSRRRYAHVEGLALRKGVTQIGVDTWGDVMGESVDVARAQLIRPIVAVMADKIQADGARTFGDLSIPPFMDGAAVASDSASGLSLRGVRLYNVERADYDIRLDCIYA